MGMFDEIRVELLLPDRSEISTEWFQTKSFENVMTKYVITAKGELYEELWDWEWMEADTHWLGGYIQKIDGSYRREYLTDYHGDIIFYGSRPQSTGEWQNYHARFTNGKLTRIWVTYTKY